MRRPAHRVSEEQLGLQPPEVLGSLEEAAVGIASEDPERIPHISRTCPPDVRIVVPPARPGLACHILERVVDLETTDEVKLGVTIDGLQAGEKDDQVAALCAAEAECAARAPAVVAVSRHGAREVGIYMDGATSPARGCVVTEV